MQQISKSKSPAFASPHELLDAARRAAGRAYCPYSKFPVGAAVLAADGRVFEGCNVENASYGLAICAERVAIFSAVAAGARRISKIAVFCPEASATEPGTSMPCGACRQAMAEFMDPDGEILVDGVGVFTLRQLLPQPFELKRN
jgi:cytidine deaminase